MDYNENIQGIHPIKSETQYNLTVGDKTNSNIDKKIKQISTPNGITEKRDDNTGCNINGDGSIYVIPSDDRTIGNGVFKSSTQHGKNINHHEKHCLLRFSAFKSPVFVLVLFGGMLAQFITTGIIRTQGMINLELVDLYDLGSDSASWISFTLNITIAILGPVSGVMCQKFCKRTIIIIAGLVGTVALIGTSFCNTVFQVIITYGLLVGIPYRFAWTATVVYINEHFHDHHRFLSNGFMFSGSSIGGISLPFLITWFSYKFSPRGAIFLMGGVWLHLLIAGMLLNRVLIEDTHHLHPGKQQNQRNQNSARHSNIVELTNMEAGNGTCNKTENHRKCAAMFKKIKSGLKNLFTIKYLGTLCIWFGITVGMTAVPQFLPFYAQENGLNKTVASTLLAVVYAFDLVFRITLSLVGDWKRVNRGFLLSILLILTGTFSILFSIFTNRIMFYIYAAVHGSFCESTVVFIGYTVEKSLPKEYMGLGLGCITSLYGISGMIVAAIVGHLQKYTKTYVSFLYLTGSLQITGAIVYLLSRTCSSNQCSKLIDSIK